MKLLQAIVALLVVVGLIGLATFVSQYTRTSITPTPSTAVTAATSSNVSPLQITERIAVWGTGDGQYTEEMEKGSKTHYDFWVSNPHAQPVTVILRHKSCICTTALLGLFAPEDLPDARKLLAEPAKRLEASALLARVKWHPLFEGTKELPVTVLPADGSDPQPAIIRLEVDGREHGAKRLTADIQHQLPDGSTEVTRFEVPVLVVSGLLVSPSTLSVGDMKANDRRDLEFLAWTPTRNEIAVKAEEPTGDPCVVIAPPQHLTAAEAEQAGKDLMAANPSMSHTRVRDAYRIKLTVFERREGRQLDIGPLSRRVVLNAGTDTESSVAITGMVRGEIRVGDTSDKDRVDLGSFRADHPHDKTVVVSSLEPGLKLSVDSKTPEELQVQLQEQPPDGGPRRWKLTVTVPAGTLSGPMPTTSAVVLRTQAEPPRRIRIPVTGNAFSR
jgi:hypothetical protein